MTHVDFESRARYFGRTTSSNLKLRTPPNGVTVPICEIDLNPAEDYSQGGNCFGCPAPSNFSFTYSIDRSRSSALHPLPDAVGGMHFSDVGGPWNKERVTYVEVIPLDGIPDIINVWLAGTCTWQAKLVELIRPVLLDAAAPDPRDIFTFESDSRYLLDPQQEPSVYLQLEQRQAMLPGSIQFEHWRAGISEQPVNWEETVVRAGVGLGLFAVTWSRNGQHVLGPAAGFGVSTSEFGVEAPDAAIAWRDALPSLSVDSIDLEVECGRPSGFRDDTNTLSFAAS